MQIQSKNMLRLGKMLNLDHVKINSTLIENAEDLDRVMPMYNLIEYSQNYSMASGNVWNYYRDEIDGVDDKASDVKSFESKTKIVRKTAERPQSPAQPQSQT